MKSEFLKTVSFILCALFAAKSFSQNVTAIDYQAWNPSSPPCDVFNTVTNVPATINGTSSIIGHLNTDWRYEI